MEICNEFHDLIIVPDRPVITYILTVGLKSLQIVVDWNVLVNIGVDQREALLPGVEFINALSVRHYRYDVVVLRRFKVVLSNPGTLNTISSVRTVPGIRRASSFCSCISLAMGT